MSKAPGMVIFSRSMQVRWMNQRARDLMARTGTDAWLSAGNLPLQVVDLAARMFEELDARVPAQGWTHVKINKSVRTPEGGFDLRGFGFPGLDQFANFHFVILIAEAVESDLRVEDGPELVTCS
jgi:hypothetical protein